jgi:hypothetical protein
MASAPACGCRISHARWRRVQRAARKPVEPAAGWLYYVVARISVKVPLEISTARSRGSGLTRQPRLFAVVSAAVLRTPARDDRRKHGHRDGPWLLMLRLQESTLAAVARSWLVRSSSEICLGAGFPLTRGSMRYALLLARSKSGGGI